MGSRAASCGCKCEDHVPITISVSHNEIINLTIQERLGRDIQALCAAINFPLKGQFLTKPTWFARNTYLATKYLYLHPQLYIHLPKLDGIHLPAASEQEICILRTFGLIYCIGFYFQNIRGKPAESVGRQQKGWDTIFL